MTKEDFTSKAMTLSTVDEFNALYDELTKSPSKAQAMTKNGATVLKFLQTRPTDHMVSKDIGVEIDLSSRSVSGSLRKLVADGYVEKTGSNPTSYRITAKGLDYNF